MRKSTYVAVGAAVLMAGGISTGLACEMAAMGKLEDLRLAKPVEGQVGAGFGDREHPILRVVRPHPGIDFIAPIGTPVITALAGRIVEARFSGEHGNRIVVDHGQGVTSSYSHLSRNSDAAREGSCVRSGEVIGYVGNTGLAAEPHLHFELQLNTRAVDPAPLLGLASSVGRP